MPRKAKKQIKWCPFFESECKGLDCMIFNEKVNRCEIGLMAYNTYYLTKAINDCFGKQKSYVDSKLARN
ncbi:MAG: hypothetical protein EHM38_10260 [Geobacteraceae bacterium]|jgi:hypothetical protein|nr:MAG: hypothetical protein EHM38_10260 [Geobacteraceae bacterium]